MSDIFYLAIQHYTLYYCYLCLVNVSLQIIFDANDALQLFKICTIFIFYYVFGWIITEHLCLRNVVFCFVLC